MSYRDRRVEWTQQFEHALLQRNPAYAGRIDWDAAMALFFRGIFADSAAETFSRTIKPLAPTAAELRERSQAHE